MPSMANITVKNAANADVIYVAATPSGGDRLAARWTQNAASAILGHRPKFQVTTRDTQGSKPARHVDFRLDFPVVETINGIPTIVAVVPMSGNGVIPLDVDGTKVQDAFVQAGNLLVSTLVREIFATGYAPT